MSDVNKREFIALPIDYCYFDRIRYDKLQSELPTEIISYRKYENGPMRILFATKEIEKGKEIIERNHLLWIQLMEIDGKKFVKYCCDCKYFDYRQIRPAKRLVDLVELDSDLVAILNSKDFTKNKAIFNIDKHAFLALKELFKIAIQISI
ncbi:MAG: hypothetical protein ACFFDW_11170 [Candidatus Thorarchaeota archaeon]